jgi:hypothetical protein
MSAAEASRRTSGLANKKYYLHVLYVFNVGGGVPANTSFEFIQRCGGQPARRYGQQTSANLSGSFTSVSFFRQLIRYL